MDFGTDMEIIHAIDIKIENETHIEGIAEPTQCQYCHKANLDYNTADLQIQKEHVTMHANEESQATFTAVSNDFLHQMFRLCFPNSLNPFSLYPNEEEVCGLCLKDTTPEDQVEPFLTCCLCAIKIHPSCISYPLRLAESLLTNSIGWTCLNCRICIKCHHPINDSFMNTKICYNCDRTFHRTCVSQIGRVSFDSDPWHLCEHCHQSHEFMCATSKPSETVDGFQCQFCPKTFLTQDNLDSHKNGCMSMRPYICDIEDCTKRFKTIHQHQMHMNTHQGIRPYLCSYCPKTFAIKHGLEQHMRTHTNHRPYMCNYCSKTFTQQCHLIQHTRLHTGERPFVCMKCGAAFRQQSNLQSHMKNRHRDRIL